MADVVVYDYLANKAFLDFCRKDAEIYYVGKKGGDHTLPQDKINDLLALGAAGALLSGTGSAVFGLFRKRQTATLALAMLTGSGPRAYLAPL